MAIIVDENTKAIVQGITGYQGSFHTERMLKYGTKIVGGVTPGKGGSEVHGVPVFDSVRDATRSTGANASVIFVPAPFAADAAIEALDAGIKVVVCITEGIPVHDELKMYWKAKDSGAILTFSSLRIIPIASFTTSAEAPPPMSRKFAGFPPSKYIRSIVDIDIPAPLAITPIFPSSLT